MNAQAIAAGGGAKGAPPPGPNVFLAAAPPRGRGQSGGV